MTDNIVLWLSIKMDGAVELGDHNRFMLLQLQQHSEDAKLQLQRHDSNLCQKPKTGMYLLTLMPGQLPPPSPLYVLSK